LETETDEGAGEAGEAVDGDQEAAVGDSGGSSDRHKINNIPTIKVP